MKTKVLAVSAGLQKFEFTAETAQEVAALKAFERVLKSAAAQVSYQESVEVLNVSFAITPEELAQWKASGD